MALKLESAQLRDIEVIHQLDKGKVIGRGFWRYVIITADTWNLGLQIKIEKGKDR